LIKIKSVDYNFF